MNLVIDNPDIVYFSRGFGRGHAIPDLAILDALCTIAPQLRVCVCSYATGLLAFQQAGQPAFDLDLPGSCSEWKAVQRIGQFLRRTSARLLVSHEEFGAVPAAEIFGLPSVFITHWFGPEHISRMQALADADLILFYEAQGLFLEPTYLQGKIRYVDPVLRRFRFLPSDRQQIRLELGISGDQIVVTCLLGSWGESKTPVVDLILEAFQALSAKKKRLIWIASEDFDMIAEKCSDKNDITVVECIQEPERLMIASDLAITKGTYNVGKELEAIGVPSISLSHGKNPIDDYLSRCLPNNTFLFVNETTPPGLTMRMEEALHRGLGTSKFEAMNGSGAAKIAKCLVEYLNSSCEPAL